MIPSLIRPAQKVRARYDATPALSGTLEKLVENEKGEKKRTATEGLMWLLRGLQFTCKALQIAQQNKTIELAAAFSQAYEATLKKFHNFVVKGIFSVRDLPATPRLIAPADAVHLQVAMKACPYRQDFFSKLSADPAGGPSVQSDELDEELNNWLASLDAIVTRLQTFYEVGGYNKGL